MRSSWKPTFSFSFPEGDPVSRSISVGSDRIGHRVRIRSGNRVGWVQVRPPMVGLKYGVFLLTKRLGRDIHLAKFKSKKRKHGSRS